MVKIFYGCLQVDVDPPLSTVLNNYCSIDKVHKSFAQANMNIIRQIACQSQYPERCVGHRSEWGSDLYC